MKPSIGRKWLKLLLRFPRCTPRRKDALWASPAAPVHKPPYPCQSFFDVLHVRRVGAADEALAARTERRARNYCHFFLPQQGQGEVVGGQAGSCHVRKGVEGAEGAVTFQAHVFEGSGDEVTAALILRNHFSDV